MQSKNELRVFAKNLRQNLDMKSISDKILKNFVASDYYKNAQNIAAYYPFGTEVDIKDIFRDKTKSFSLPKISGENCMTFHKYLLTDSLKTNIYGIPEPIGDEIVYNDIDLIILPALMADKQGYRLGYGKGYYDRFLSEKKSDAIKVILIPDDLLTENLPTDEFDIPANVIITEKRVIEIK